MDRALLPPAPYLFGHEWKEGCEQAQQRVETVGECRLRGISLRLPLAAVCPLLHELDVIVGEIPEEALGYLERLGVVELLEGSRRLPHGLGEGRDPRPVMRLGDRRGIVGRVEHEDELARIEDLDGESAADLHLPDVERGVGARPA